MIVATVCKMSGLLQEIELFTKRAVIIVRVCAMVYIVLLFKKRPVSAFDNNLRLAELLDSRYTADLPERASSSFVSNSAFELLLLQDHQLKSASMTGQQVEHRDIGDSDACVKNKHRCVKPSSRG